MSSKETHIIFGLHSSLSAITNKNRSIKKIILTEEVLGKNKKIFESITNVEKKILNRKQIDSLTGVKIHQGIVVYADSLPVKAISDIRNEEDLVIILDSLNDPQNVGSIIRTAYAFGVKTIIYSKHNSFEITPFLIKSASGAFENVKLIEVTNLNKTIDFLKKNNFWIVGLDSKSEIEISSVPKDLKKAVVFGSENKGIKKLILDNCDFRVKVNIKKDKLIDSLNVSNAAAITLFEFRKK
ncbi:MAG: 23S rRNA (guanosine(2251)-2'-O)-methyltransferase RlmB [Alphaproteobacteria bacterium]|jgi:23S rRNA (guanosine2251-2'-O)-methyltransferase